MRVGWIQLSRMARPVAVELLVGLGITIGDFDWRERMWNDCLVTDEAMDVLDRHWGSLMWALEIVRENVWVLGARLWKEDECLLRDPNAERLPAAWMRIFGEPLPEKGLCLHHDGGDGDFYLAPNGATFWSGFDGHEIYDVAKKT